MSAVRFCGATLGEADVLGKGKGKGAKGGTRQCYQCARRGHVQNDCFFKHLPWDQTPLGHRHNMMQTRKYKGSKGSKKGLMGTKGFGKPQSGKPFQFSSKEKYWIWSIWPFRL